MKLKGLKKLNKSISAQVAPFGIKKAKCGTEYTYSFVDNEITFKITEGTIEDIWFQEFIKERFNIEGESFLLSILHEVGHSIANEEIEGAIYDFCLSEKSRISAEMQDADEIRSKELEWEYFNLPDEIMATQWAVNWIKEHPKKTKKMYKACIKALIDFYETNNVKE